MSHFAFFISRSQQRGYVKTWVYSVLSYGYTCDEVEEMLVDHSLLREALKDVKYLAGESIYEEYCGVF